MFRFTIRDVLWLMLAAGLATGWLSEHRRAEREHLDAIKASTLKAEYDKLKFTNEAITAAWKSSLSRLPTEAPLPRE